VQQDTLNVFQTKAHTEHKLKMINKHRILNCGKGILASCLLVCSAASHATLFEVVLSTDILSTDFKDYPVGGGDGDIFGIAPTDMTFSVSLLVDTSTGVDSANAGDSTTISSSTYQYSHDVWGYSAVSMISGTFIQKLGWLIACEPRFWGRH